MGFLQRLLRGRDRGSPKLDGEKLAQLLERVPGFRVLRELAATGLLDELTPPQPGERIAAVVDTETTGLDPTVDRLVEIAIERFTFDAQGQIVAIERPRSWLEDPGMPLPERLSLLTGLKDTDLAGREFDEDRVICLLESADLIIAHNAAFDRPFLDRRFPSIQKRPWACSLSQVDWLELGFDGRALGHLLLQRGWFFRGHRADKDVHALTTLLGSLASDRRTILAHLLERCERPTFRVEAVGAPFDAKHALKARGYRWDPQRRHWWLELEESEVEAETNWLAQIVYVAGGAPRIHRVTAEARFMRSS